MRRLRPAITPKTIAVLIAALVWTGHSQRWFTSRVTLRIALPEDGAAGIRQGSEVYFLGTLVGSVTGVDVDAKGRMEAEANIRRDFFQFVRLPCGDGDFGPGARQSARHRGRSTQSNGSPPSRTHRSVHGGKPDLRQSSDARGIVSR